MTPTSSSKKCGSVFFGIGLAVLGALFGASLQAQAPNPVPLINQPLVPDATAPGSPQFTLTINGTGFASNATVNWNGSPLATTFVSGSELTAVVPAADVATASTGWVTVVNPAPGGGTSNVAFFTATYNTENTITFNPPLSIALPGYAQAVAVGDFNGDGKLDLAVASYSSYGAVFILLGDGTGNFTLASSPATGFGSWSVAVGDFNGDGKLDLAVANSASDTVSILLGDGTGNFTLASSPVVNYSPKAVAVGDFNGDGNLDLAVTTDCGNDPTCSSPGTVVILLGDGIGNFTLASTTATGYFSRSIAVGDFNGDGKLDVAAGNWGSNTVSVLLGDGTGNLTLVSSPPTGELPDSVTAGDVNGDGILDLAVASYYGNAVTILIGDGTGNFYPASPVQGTGIDFSVAMGDFNGDNNLDLAVVSDYTSTVPILLGDGTGNFTLASSPATGNYPIAEAVGDFNGDGRLDVVTANAQGNTVSILLQVPPAPAVTLLPTSLSFGTQLIGTSSSPQTVTLTNGGTAPLDITSITASANFSQTNTCGTSLSAGTTCAITVTFTPLSVGTLTGSVTITDNASNSPQTVSLTGVGTEVTLSPSSLNFYKQSVGTTSAPQTITLTNLGDQALVIAAIHVGGADAGDFAQTNTCGRGIAAGSSCAISVTFTPQAKGSRQAVIGVRDNGGASPQTVSLRGYGM